MRGILIPSIEWRHGAPNTKIREGSLICIKKIIDLNLIEKDKLYQNFKQDGLMTNLKNCLDDDYTSQIRFIATIVLNTLIEALNEPYEYDDYKETYPELLKRLDDS